MEDVPFDKLIENYQNDNSNYLEALPHHLRSFLTDNKEKLTGILQKLTRNVTEETVIYTLEPEKSKNFMIKLKSEILKRLLDLEYLNVPQRYILTLVERPEDLIISAPTGCGKTIIAMIFILSTYGVKVTAGDDFYKEEIEKYQKISQDLQISPKTVYLVPQKALSTQIFQKISSRFQNVLLLTSDSSKKYEPCNILITTPERYLFLLIRLNLQPKMLILDEIHGIGTERGPTLETIISLTKAYNSSSVPNKTRIIGLSATIPNIDELADYLKAKPIHFDESFRPIQLTKKLVVVKDELKKSDKKRKLDQFDPDKISTIIKGLLKKEGKTVIFVRSRKNVEKFHKIFSDEQNNHLRDSCDSESFNSSQEQIKFLYHHASLSLQKRQSTEVEFRNSKNCCVLFSTSTLAWGVDLPIDTAIVLDEFDDIDIVQMMGRAGRRFFNDKNQPKIEQSAHLITTNKKKLEFLLNLNPLKSQTKNLKMLLLLSVLLEKDLIRETLWCYEKKKEFAKIKTVEKNPFHLENLPSEIFDVKNLFYYAPDDFSFLKQHNFIVTTDKNLYGPFLSCEKAKELFSSAIKRKSPTKITKLSVFALISIFYQIPPETVIYYLQAQSIYSELELIKNIKDHSFERKDVQNLNAGDYDSISNSVLKNILRHLWCIFHLSAIYCRNYSALFTLKLIRNIETHFSSRFENNEILYQQKSNFQDKIELIFDFPYQIYSVALSFELKTLPKGDFQFQTDEIFSTNTCERIQVAKWYKISSTFNDKPISKNIFVQTNTFSHFCSYKFLKKFFVNSMTVEELNKEYFNFGTNYTIKELDNHSFDEEELVILIGTVYKDKNGNLKLIKPVDLFAIEKENISIIGNGFDYSV